MAGHTSMPQRKQKTPHGVVTLTSRWMQGRYYLVASGSLLSLKWLFPNHQNFEKNGIGYRHTFSPGPEAVTVERVLRSICAQWQAKWDDDLSKMIPIVENQTEHPADIITIGDLFSKYHEIRKDKVAPRTYDREIYRLRLWSDELGADKILNDLDANRVATALNRIAAKVSPFTANASFGTVKTYLNWAVNMGYMTDIRYRTVKKIRESSKARHQQGWWTIEDFEKVMECAVEDHHQPTATLLVACGIFLGLRPEEMVMLRWQDLNLDAKDPKTGLPRPVCHICEHDGWKPKAGESRDIPIPAPLHEILLRFKKLSGYLIDREPGRIGRPRAGKGIGYRYDPKKVWLRIMERFQKRGGRVINRYGMRHSFASNLLMASVSDVKVSRWLGHSDTRMLHRHYGHLLSYDDDINALTLPSSDQKKPVGDTNPSK